MRRISTAIISLICLACFAQGERFQAEFKIEKVHNKKLVRIEGEAYYDISQKRMVLHYTYPNEHIFISNHLGEAQIYYPENNEVLTQQSSSFSADIDVLFYFFTKQTSDLGFQKLGFQLLNTKYEGNLLITTWLAPEHLQKTVSKVELVLENYSPIYCSYLNKDGKITQKTYYDHYGYVGNHYLPKRVTEMLYTPKGDSILSRKKYSNVLEVSKDKHYYLDFKIPKDAKSIKLKKP